MPPVRPHRRKTKRRTTYNERYNALSALDVQTRDLIQGLWAQSAMNSVRTSAEWPYETVTTLFHVMRSKHNKKMLTRQREPNTTLFAQLRVVFFLYNCYVCMNGSKFQKFFDMEPPTIEEYLTAE
jgi:alpha-ketoglutarate-dependent taurine dioxygenase